MIDWLLEDADGRDDLASLVEGIARFWEMRGHCATGRSYLVRALVHPGLVGRSIPRAIVLYHLVNLCMKIGRIGELQVHLRELVDIAAELGDEEFARRTLHMRGRIALVRGDRDEARNVFGELRDHYRAVGDEAKLASALHNYAMSLPGDEHVEACAAYRQALEINTRRGNLHWRCLNLQSLGTTLAERRETCDEAEASLRQALEIGRRMADPLLQAGALHSLSRVSGELERWDEAFQQLDDALRLNRRIENRLWEARCLERIALYSVRVGEPDRVRSNYRDALAILRQIGVEGYLWSSLRGLVWVATELGDEGDAAALTATIDAGDLQATLDLADAYVESLPRGRSHLA